MPGFFDFKNFSLHVGSDGFLYSQCNSTLEFFVWDGSQWWPLEEFHKHIALILEASQNEDDDFSV